MIEGKGGESKVDRFFSEIVKAVAYVAVIALLLLVFAAIACALIKFMAWCI